MSMVFGKEIFEKSILTSVGKKSSILNREVTGFLAIEGHAYDGGLMVIGRAVNGWTEGICTRKLSDPSNVTRYAALVEDSVVNASKCPMSWVTDSWSASQEYNTKRSAFWRCVRNVTMSLNIVESECENWSSHLVWSNLYKVSPASGGNPNSALRNAQLDGCVELLKLELRTYRPSRLLFLTGMDWAAPFLAETNLQENEEFHYVKKYGRLNMEDGFETQCVVADHPQGKPEADWVREAVTALNY